MAEDDVKFRNVKITPWQVSTKTNKEWEDNPLGITKSGVDKQDEITLEDALDNPDLVSWDNAGSILKNTGLQLLSQTYVGRIYSTIKGSEDSIRPEGTVEESDDELRLQFGKLKRLKYKTVKLTSKLGQYNSVMNLLGNASGLFVGTLGKSGVTNFADDGLKMALQSLPFSSLATNATTIISRIKNSISNSGEGVFSSITPSWEDLLSLTYANYYTILTNKPGLTIRGHRTSLEYITDKNKQGDLVSNGSKDGKGTSNSIAQKDRIIHSKKDEHEIEVDSIDSGVEVVPGENITNTELNYVTSELDNVNASEDFKEGLENQSRDERIGYITPGKEDSEEEVNTGKDDYLASDDFSVVEYVTNKNTYDGSENVGLISEEDLAKYQRKYKFLVSETNDNGQEIFTTGALYHLNNTGLVIEPSVGTSETYIVSPFRKEVEIAHGRSNLQKNINNFGLTDGEVALLQEHDAPVGTRVSKNQIYARINYKFREIGCLYVEPFYNNGQLSCFEIPFEFNPEFSADGGSADYGNIQVMGRILDVKPYTRTSSKDITLTTTYIALAPDLEENTKYINDKEQWLNGWMRDWRDSNIKQIENQLRALVMPHISEADFVRPPTVRIKMRTNTRYTGGDYSKGYTEGNFDFLNTKVSDLFSYPSLGNKIQITSKFDTKTREKRYVVKDVSIAPLDESFGFGNTYGIVDSNFFRRGFKATITLSETTRNFLDLIPSYSEYIGENSDDDESEVLPSFVLPSISAPDTINYACVADLEQNLDIDLNSINTFKGAYSKKKEPIGTIVYYNPEAQFTDEEMTSANIEEEGEFQSWLSENSKKTFNIIKKEALESGQKIKEFTEEVLKNNNFKERKAFLTWLYKNSRKDFENEKLTFNDLLEVLKNNNIPEKKIITETWNGSWPKTKEYKDWLRVEANADVLYEAQKQFKLLLNKMDLSLTESEDTETKKSTLKSLIGKFTNSAFFNERDNRGYINWLKNDTVSILNNEWYTMLEALSGAMSYFSTKWNIDYIFKDTWGSLINAMENGYGKYMLEDEDGTSVLLERMGVSDVDSLYSKCIQNLTSSSAANQQEEIERVTFICNAVKNSTISPTSSRFDEFKNYLSLLANGGIFTFVYEGNDGEISFFENIKNDFGISKAEEKAKESVDTDYNIYKILTEAGYTEEEIVFILSGTNWSQNGNFQNFTKKHKSSTPSVEEDSSEFTYYDYQPQEDNSETTEEDNSDLEIDNYWVNNWNDDLKENNFFYALYERAKEDEGEFVCEKDNDY